MKIIGIRLRSLLKRAMLARPEIITADHSK
jgi:hypothetical protein